MATSRKSNFNDFLPLMAEKLGGDGLIGELCKGFQLLMDRDKGVITFESLKKNSALLGLQDLSDDDLKGMVKEGDFDGDGALNQMEFCVLMFRLSPELMEESQFLLDEALHQEFNFSLALITLLMHCYLE
ncbi:calcium-binding protein KRP1-like isoform X1 [Solanum pennellii]|uniref:Calcium-binding protein KRP1-like isoform X1 n=1 Tax=Solanum pennellii TaxID=28526 RepID=A0ABM1FG91_SOLPN|nr:calcium-binding protein KRP1-like isoform X1 [Solanum pennellii]